MASKYTFHDTIGHGNYGTCFLVTHRTEKRQYVAKRIPVRDGIGEALAEAQLLSKIKHPNVIAYKESFLSGDNGDGEEGGDGEDWSGDDGRKNSRKNSSRYGSPQHLCIVTAYAEEGDLFTHIKRARESHPRRYFPERQVLDWTAQIALALDHIHGMRVMHRDLKTQNIFLGRGGVVKLGDFGISRVLERTDDFATTVAGTPYYLSPEVCQNQPYTLKSDVWSFGCVVYEMCSLKHAFAADSLLSLVYQIVNGTCDYLGIMNMYDSRLVELIQSMLSRDCAVRPAVPTILRSSIMQEHLRNMQRDGLGRPRSAMVVENTSRLNIHTVPASLKAFVEEEDELSHPTPKEAAAMRKQQKNEARELVLKLAAHEQENVSRRGFAKEFYGRGDGGRLNAHTNGNTGEESNTSTRNTSSRNTSTNPSTTHSAQHTRDNSADLEFGGARGDSTGNTEDDENVEVGPSIGWEDEVAEYAMRHTSETGYDETFLSNDESFMSHDDTHNGSLSRVVDRLEGLRVGEEKVSEIGFVPPVPNTHQDSGTFFGTSDEMCFEPIGGVVVNSVNSSPYDATGQQQNRYAQYNETSTFGSIDHSRLDQAPEEYGTVQTVTEEDEHPDASWLESTLPNAPLSPAQSRKEHEVLAALTLDAEADVRAEEEVFQVTKFAEKHFHEEGDGRLNAHTNGNTGDERNTHDARSTPSTYDYDDAPCITKDTEAENLVLLEAAKSLDNKDREEIRAASVFETETKVDVVFDRNLDRAVPGEAEKLSSLHATTDTFETSVRVESVPSSPGPSDSALPTPVDDSVVAARAHKVSRLRAMCGAQLGDAFHEVHTFMRSARRRQLRDAEVKTRLMHLVNNDPAKLAACFAVDMLCFEEEFLFSELEQVKPHGTYAPGVNVFVSEQTVSENNEGSNSESKSSSMGRSSSSTSSSNSPKGVVSPKHALPGGRESKLTKEQIQLEREKSKKRALLPGA